MAIFLCLSFTAVSFGDGLEIGTAAPSFQVKSGDDKILTFEMIKGKLIVIFYETTDVVEKNRQLKNELIKIYNEKPDTVKELVMGLPIINCSGSFWPFIGIWKSELRKNSIKEGITIYGDWNGKMNSNYKMKAEESNIVIIDNKGIIRYFVSGKVKDEEIGNIKELLEKLLEELMYEK